MKDSTFGFVIAIGIAFVLLSFLIVLQHKAQVHGLHGFAYGNGSMYHVKCCVAPQIQKCDPDDETYNITGFCDPDDADNQSSKKITKSTLL